jgi:transcriptional regulator with XRE-family HTH domain
MIQMTRAKERPNAPNDPKAPNEVVVIDSSFGARLRQQREARHVALEDISEKTKIKASLLEELEGDDLSRWPQGIFRRAYVRAYAQAIGLEPDVVLQQFLAHYPEPVEELPLVAPESPKRPPTRLRFLLNAAFGAARQAAADTREDYRGRLDHVIRVSKEHIEPIHEPETIEHAEAPETVEGADAEHVDMPLPFVPPAMTDIADLCTRVGRASKLAQLEPRLADAVRMLNAVGAVLWTWERHKTALRARVSYGYAEDVLARFPLVGRDADNAIGVAFRSGHIAVVDGADGETGAISVPLLGPQGCVGVLALEVRHGDERNETLHAVASIVAAQFVSFCVAPALAEAVNA